MKKELMMASLLTLTAGTTSQAVFPSYAQASNKLSEKNFAREVLFKITSPARYTDDDGIIHMGHVYLYVTQDHYTPEFPNKLHAEMQGHYYFESDIEDTTYYNGKSAKTYVSLLGDDGSVLLDKVNTDYDKANTYQVYGCSSTSKCDTTDTKVTFKGDQVTISGSFENEYSNIEILQIYKNADNTISEEWIKEFWGLSTEQVLNPKN